MYVMRQKHYICPLEIMELDWAFSSFGHSFPILAWAVNSRPKLLRETNKVAEVTKHHLNKKQITDFNSLVSSAKKLLKNGLDSKQPNLD